MTSTTGGKQIEVSPWVTPEITQVHAQLSKDALRYTRRFLRSKEDSKAWPQERCNEFRRIYHYLKAMFYDTPELVIEAKHKQAINELSELMETYPNPYGLIAKVKY